MNWQTTLTAHTEAHHGWTSYHQEFAVENLSADDDVWLRADGSPAAIGEGTRLGPGEVRMLSNELEPEIHEIADFGNSKIMHLADPPDGVLAHVSAISTGTPQISVSPL